MPNRFTVTVREGGVSGSFDDGERATGELNVSRLVHVFKRWVSRGYQNVQDAAGYSVLGEALYDALFANNVGDELMHRVGNAKRDNPLHLSLDMGPYADIPWEFLKLPDNGNYMGADPRIALSRYMMLKEKPRLRVQERPQLQFVVASDPDEPVWSEGLLTYASELDAAGKVDLLETLENPTLLELKQHVGKDQPNIVYYIGHGHYNEKQLETGVRLGASHGAEGTEEIYEIEFASAFGNPAPDLIILQSCDTGAAEYSDELASLAGMAPRLMERRIPAVVAMQYEINEDAANVFGKALLENLTEYQMADLDIAVQKARVVMAESKQKHYADRDFAAPLLYFRAADAHSGSSATGEEDDPLDEGDAWFEVAVRNGRVFAQAFDYEFDEPFAIKEEIVDALIPAIRAGQSGTGEISKLLGITMYRALFPGDIGHKFRRLRDRASDETPLRLRLQIENEAIDSYPWEYLHTTPSNRSDFLARAGDVAVTRYRPGDADEPELESRKPRVLFVVSQPEEWLATVITWHKSQVGKQPRLDLDDVPDSKHALAVSLTGIVTESDLSKVDQVYKSVDEKGRPDLLFEFGELDRELAFLRAAEEEPDQENEHHRYPDVLHYIGHGSSDGYLLFHDPDNRQREDWVDPEAFAEQLFDGKAPPPLIVLHLCQGGKDSLGASFRRYAPLLLEAGARAVVATQYPLRRGHAVEFIDEFYRNLGHTTVEGAVQAARSKVRDGERRSQFYRDFAAPMLYTSSRDGLRLVLPEAQPKRKGQKRASAPATGIDRKLPAVDDELRRSGDPAEEEKKPIPRVYAGERVSRTPGDTPLKRPPR